jgi:hypothetical protein
MKLIQKLIYQGLNELEWKYHNSSCKTYADRLPTIDKLLQELQDTPNALFLSNKELKSINVGMGFEVESLESNVQDDEDNEATKEQLAVAKAVKQKIERLME